MTEHLTASGRTRVSQVMVAIEARIASRRLAPGARLPSVRDFAEEMQVSKSTVVDAYDRLVAEGAIAARRGSGFYVAGQTRPLSLKALVPQLDRAIDPLWLTRQALQAPATALKPGSGWLPSSWMPDEALQRSLRHLARSETQSRVHYDEPQGFGPLRQHLSRRLAERGIAAAAEQIVLTDSGSQALDLICRFLLEPGDAVLVDDPCYFNFHALLRAHRARVVGVPYTAQGADLEAFATALVAHRPRFYLTNCGPHNPTGAGLTRAQAHKLLKLAEAHGTSIVEDDVFADLEREPTVRLAEMDGFDRVIQVGSYSKTVSAAIRCGYVAVRPDWVEELVDLKLAINLGNSRSSATLLHHLLTDGTYRRHIDALHARLSAAMGQTLGRLASLGLTPFVEPRAGAFVWARLPDGIDAADVARRALADEVIFAPGNVFSASHTAAGYMRFNVARCGHPRIFEVLARTMDDLGRHGDRGVVDPIRTARVA